MHQLCDDVFLLRCIVVTLFQAQNVHWICNWLLLEIKLLSLDVAVLMSWVLYLFFLFLFISLSFSCSFYSFFNSLFFDLSFVLFPNWTWLCSSWCWSIFSLLQSLKHSLEAVLQFETFYFILFHFIFSHFYLIQFNWILYYKYMNIKFKVITMWSLITWKEKRKKMCQSVCVCHFAKPKVLFKVDQITYDHLNTD